MKIKELFYRIKTPVRASIFYLGASVIGKAIGLITTPFFTRALSVEEYGKFSLYMSLLGGVSVILSAFNSGSSVFIGLSRYKNDKIGYLKSVMLVSSAFSALVCLLLLIFSSFLGIDARIIGFLTLQVLCDGILAATLSLSKYEYSYTKVFIISVISAALPPLMAAFLLKQFGGGYLVRIFTLLAVSFCLAVYSIIVLSRKTERTEVSKVRSVIKNSLPLLPHTVSSAMAVQADKIILSSVMGEDALAKYAVVYSLGAGLGFTVGAIGSALGPWIIRRLEGGESEKISELVFPMVLGYFALSAAVVAFAPETIKILAPISYLDALPALLPLTLCTPFTFLSTVATVGLIHGGKGRESVLASCVGAVLCLALNFMLIPRFGYFGAGLSMLVSKMVEAVIAIYFLSKNGVKGILSPKLVFPILVSVGAGLCFYLLREQPTQRFLLLFFPFSILVYSLWKGKSLLLEKG